MRQALAVLVFGMLSVFITIGTAQQTPQEQAGMAWLAAAGKSPSQLHSVELRGDVITYAGGEKRRGRVTLKAAGGGSRSRTEFDMGNGSLIEIRNDEVQAANQWIDTASKSHVISNHNTWTSAAWFFPAFLPLRQWNSAEITFNSEVQNETGSDIRIHSEMASASKSSRSEEFVRRLSGAEYRIDPNSFLLQSIRFNTHPDQDLKIDIAVEVRFSQYRLVDGVRTRGVAPLPGFGGGSRQPGGSSHRPWRGGGSLGETATASRAGSTLRCDGPSADQAANDLRNYEKYQLHVHPQWFD